MNIRAMTKRLGVAILALALAFSLAAPASAATSSSIASLKAIPDVLAPGIQAMIQIKVENTATTADANVVVMLEMLPLILPDIAMLSVGNNSPKYISWQKTRNMYYFNLGTIPAKTSATISLGITVSDETPSGKYPKGCQASIIYGMFPGPSTTLDLYIDLPSNPDPGKKDITTLPDRFDDDNGHWAQSYINILADAGVMNGMGSGKFAPDTGLTRAMTCQILYNLYGNGEFVPTGPFVDLTEEWYVNAVNWAAKLGIAPSVSETQFAPNSPAPREDVLLVFSKMAEIRSATLPETHEQRAFLDDGNISPEARDAVYAFQRAGIISGDDRGCFNPKSQITRAEFTKILCLYLDAAGELDYDITSLK